MSVFRIRFNKTRGQEGRGTMDHIWRVFTEDNKEYLCKNILILTQCRGDKDPNGQDYNIVADGKIGVDKETSTITIF